MKKWTYVLLAAMLMSSLCACGSIVEDVKDNINHQYEWTKENHAGGDNYDGDLADAIINIINGENEEHIQGVKGGTNSAYPSVTYGEAFENFFSNPSWRYFVGTQDGPDEDGDGEPDYTVDNVDVVEFTGGCLYANVEVTALIQFVLDNEAGTFQPVYLSFNKVPQNMLMLSGLIDTVFSQATEDLNPPQSNNTSEPSQDNHPAAPVSSDFVGTWVDTTSTYQMDISYEGELYTIMIAQEVSSIEWNMWYLEGAYEQNFGIFCWGTYVDQLLRDDGTVFVGTQADDVDDVIYFGDDGLLHWTDSVLGLSDIRFTKQ